VSPDNLLHFALYVRILPQLLYTQASISRRDFMCHRSECEVWAQGTPVTQKTLQRHQNEQSDTH